MNNSSSNLKKLISFNNRKILIIHGSNSFKYFLDRSIIKNFLRNNKIQYFKKKKEYPEINELKKLIIDYKKFKPDILISVGGGSVIDYLKLCVKLSNSKNIDRSIEKNLIHSKKKTFISSYITTAGSGAECTKFSVVYKKSKKFSYVGEHVLRNHYIYDREAVKNLPKKLRASCAFDTFAQCFESLLSLSSNNQSIKYASKGLAQSNKCLIDYVTKPNNLNVSKMIRATIYSGKAINISKTNAPHAFSYPFTYFFGINHGSAVALNFLQIIDYMHKKKNFSKNKNYIEKRFKLIFKILDVKNFRSLKKKLKNILVKCKIQKKNLIKKSKINNNLFKIINNINIERLSNCPVTICRADMIKIVKKFD